MRLSMLFTNPSEEKLTIRRAKVADRVELQIICDAWIEKGFFDGETLPSDYIEQCLTKGDLPPVSNAAQENYGLYVVEFELKVMGLFDLYDGYPQDGIAWISLFLLDIESRGMGFGKSIINKITDECLQHGFESLALAVSMNNRVALKFWIQNGFKEILGIYGDLKYPNLGLKKTLSH
ncbi:MAG: GNAT family N-acetyltransferase [Erysipelotrichaceae bacterium]|nr:GNAT family N-acetyltransferase [Erysipelotrichaceae bacterium]MDP3306190.1 GNAT family N-acetyltransferase [Erysipelotrichaceae bacterium]